MYLDHIVKLLRDNPQYRTLCKMTDSDSLSGFNFFVKGLYGSARNVTLFSLLDSVKSKFSIVYLVENEEKAQYAYADIQALMHDNPIDVDILYFPSAFVKHKTPDASMEILRVGTLTHLTDNKIKPYILITYPKAVVSALPPKNNFEGKAVFLQTTNPISQTELINKLLELNFISVDFVYEPGQFSVRGGIVDVFSYAHENPYRILFGATSIDSVKEFDIENQISIRRVEEIQIIGNENAEFNENADSSSYSIFDYLSTSVIFVANDFVSFFHDAEDLGMPSKCFDSIYKASTIEIGTRTHFTATRTFTFHILPQPSYNKNINLFIEDIQSKIKEGYSLFIMSEQVKQLDRIEEILKEANITFGAVNGILHEGYIDKDRKVICYTDHQIFERYHRVSFVSDNVRRGKVIFTLKELNQLHKGDFVVHQDHGIGRFDGLVNSYINGKPQEMIKLLYRDGDAIYVSIHNLHRISKFKGKEGTEPTIAKIGSSAWEKMKERTKDKVKAIARELILLYARRKKQKGFSFTPDGYLQQRLEAGFIYEDTPDQLQTTLDVKRDMERDIPMDRLICGDVGFGKTEIAIRAAFKAVTDGKQVAVLVPTTVLALQHYNTFKSRLKDMPVNVEYVSRAKNIKELKDIKEKLKNRKIDILIGTHKIVNKDIVWNDLGLLIIDEEQKFGVAIKEKIKNYKPDIDVLTLSATPIPRTLQFSLLGARDLSIINTPPPNRYPVQTEMLTLDDSAIIKEAIELEINRNGQIFVVCNRIEMLPRIENQIKNLCSEARIVVAHGQMPPKETEKRIEDFINYEYDILLSTTIIESGVDIPNVNTIFIYSAQNYGLADLHQLRGRVGRANRKSYCYLITPSRQYLSSDAKKRLDALITFSDLGSGFNLSLQDLDIRGAGNLLGPEQSGFIADMGYETYQRILNEAVREIKNELIAEENEENEDVFNGTEENNNWSPDCTIESDLSLCLPTEYVESVSERISLYKELDSLKNEQALSKYIANLIDRFGPLPEQVNELLNVVRLRWLGCLLGIEKIFLKKEQLTLYFITSNNSFWQSEVFGKMIYYVYNHPYRCRLVEGKDQKGEKTGKRYVVVSQVRTVSGALHLLNRIKEVHAI